jgi:hypothetical protein
MRRNCTKFRSVTLVILSFSTATMLFLYYEPWSHKKRPNRQPQRCSPLIRCALYWETSEDVQPSNNHSEFHTADGTAYPIFWPQQFYRFSRRLPLGALNMFDTLQSMYACLRLQLLLNTTAQNLIFCWPCIIVYQYNGTNVMYFSFNLLRIKGLYMFRALLAHPQEALHNRHLVYCVRIMSVGCATIAVSLTLYACNTPSAVCETPLEDKQVMLETYRGPWISRNWMKSASRRFHYTDRLCTKVQKKQ